MKLLKNFDEKINGNLIDNSGKVIDLEFFMFQSS